jgi:hypothetical protein
LAHRPAAAAQSHRTRATDCERLLGVFAECERAMIRERVMAGPARARREGIALGRKPRGNERLIAASASSSSVPPKRRCPLARLHNRFYRAGFFLNMNRRLFSFV